VISLWRVYREIYGTGLDGAGGLLQEGRWHVVGSRVAYFSLSPAMAVLEVLAHTGLNFPTDLQLAKFTFSAEVSATPARPEDYYKLPVSPGWEKDQKITQSIGQQWLAVKRSCLLYVPSVLIPEETNVIFNPLHPDGRLLKLEAARLFQLDQRILSV
jgi:RES domain-containing protein